MPESAKHIELVRCILTYIQNNYSGIRQVAMLHDLPGFVGCDKPPKIATYRPDVYAIDAPLSRTIVGEAKTQIDLEADHSKNQFMAFLSFLRVQPRPTLIVSVPWQAKATARSLLQGLCSRLDAQVVQVVVIDDAEELR